MKSQTKQEKTSAQLDTMPGRNLTAWEWREVKEAAQALARLEGIEPKKALNRLAEKGCDSRYLSDKLGFIATNPDRAENWKGFGRDFRTVIKRMRQCAEDVRRVNNAMIGNVVLFLHSSSAVKVHLSVLPETLLGYAEALESLSSIASTRKRTTRDNAIALIVCHVQNQAGRPHDKEVSSLLSSALNNPNYSIQAHKDWRAKNRTLVSAVQAIAPSLPNLDLPIR